MDNLPIHILCGKLAALRGQSVKHTFKLQKFYAGIHPDQARQELIALIKGLERG